jgi:hypothetical protein
LKNFPERPMKRVCLLLLPIVVTSCELNPFKKEEPVVYKPYYQESREPEGAPNLKGVENVVYYMEKEFKPLSGEIVLNSYDGFVIDLGKKDGVSVGDRFVSESGAVLKVTQVKDNYCVALPTLGSPTVGEKVEKLLFNRVLFLDFTGKEGRELYSSLKKKVPNLKLAPYEEGEKFKKKFKLKFPSDFKRRVPPDKLTGYDGYLVVSQIGVELYDSTKKLLKLFPWKGAPVSTFSASPRSLYKVVLDFKGHATSLFSGNVDSTPKTS